MGANTDIQIPEPENEKIRPETVDEPMVESTPMTEQASHFPNLTSAYATMLIRNSRISTLVVVNESGYLVPVFTVSDLLFEFKKIWRATQ